MKIAIICSGHIPSQWAHSITTAKMADAFHKLSHHVELLAVERFMEGRQKKIVKDVHELYGISRDIKIVYFRDNSPFYFQEVRPCGCALRLVQKVTRNRLSYILDPERKISRYCKDNEMDFSYCRSYRIVRYNIENQLSTIMESHTPHIKHPDLQRVIKLSCSRYFKGLVTISEILKQNFIRAGVPKEKILVLQDGVDVESFQNLPSQPEIREMLNLPSDKKLVIYCGSLFPDKGIEHILLVAKNLMDVMFILVGGREGHIRMWRNYVNSRQISNVEFTGFVENSRVPLYLKAADALIMPYKTEQKTRIMDIHTTSPLKLFEYMAAKKPIISTNIPAISRTIKHGVDGLLAEPNDIGELAHLVEVVLEDKKLAENLSHNAYEKVQEYDWKKRCEMILQYAGIGGKR